MANLIILAAVAVFVWTSVPVFAQEPPTFPTELDLNLLNADGSNVDIGLLLTIDYLDGDSNPQSINSADNSNIITWDIYNGKSNVYALVAAKYGTGITITVNTYGPITVTAAIPEPVSGDYILDSITSIPTTATTTVPSTTAVPSDTTTTAIPATTTILGTTTSTAKTNTIPTKTACGPTAVILLATLPLVAVGVLRGKLKL